MSIHLMSEVWKNAPYAGNELLCLLACADWANDDGEFYPSYKTICIKLRIKHRRSAMRLIAAFVKDGIISKSNRRTKGPNSTNIFKLHPENFNAVKKQLDDPPVTKTPAPSVRKMVTHRSSPGDSPVIPLVTHRSSPIYEEPSCETSGEPSLHVEQARHQSLPEFIPELKKVLKNNSDDLSLAGNKSYGLPKQKTGKRSKLEPVEKKRPPEFWEVFEHWKLAMNHPGARADDKRERVILARLRDGFTVEDMKSAIDGCRLSSWHNGTDPKNTSGVIYDQLPTILRDADQVEKLMGIAKTANGNGHLNGNGNGHKAEVWQCPVSGTGKYGKWDIPDSVQTEVNELAKSDVVAAQRLVKVAYTDWGKGKAKEQKQQDADMFF